MSVKILVNTLPASYGSAVSAAVVAAIGRRPPSEDWNVSLIGRQGREGCLVQIERPDGELSRWLFEGCADEPIKDTIRWDLRKDGYVLGSENRKK